MKKKSERERESKCGGGKESFAVFVCVDKEI